jgi:hypothetical protein
MKIMNAEQILAVSGGEGFYTFFMVMGGYIGAVAAVIGGYGSNPSYYPETVLRVTLGTIAGLVVIGGVYAAGSALVEGGMPA